MTTYVIIASRHSDGRVIEYSNPLLNGETVNAYMTYIRNFITETFKGSVEIIYYTTIKRK